MLNKGLDAMFMHYGVRKEDMDIIKRICEEHEVDFDWFKDEIIRQYHELKMKNEDIEGKVLQNLVEKALDSQPK